ncbi:CHAT domain-containing protein [Streptomyces sp. NBC_01451]|uniref:CHAT domain-containing protein n=1 Tax=Streptomyces sp. NBC_01451 TaxID=2903872 RepID=UPI002E356751|nr:CHAT domain-containing protein [Streptomyces sp. NBC_01451]
MRIPASDEGEAATLRARATRLAAEAVTLIAVPRVPLETLPDSTALDRTIEQLTGVEAELSAAFGAGGETEPLTATVRRRLGGLYATRYLAGRSLTDRAEATRLLRAVHADGRTGPEEQRSTEVWLALLLVPPEGLTGWDSTADGAMAAWNMGFRAMTGQDGTVGDLAELSELLEGMAGRLPPEDAAAARHHAGTMDLARRLLSGQDDVDPTRLAEIAKEMADQQPGPMGDILRALLSAYTDFLQDPGAATGADTATVPVSLTQPGTVTAPDTAPETVGAPGAGPDAASGTPLVGLPDEAAAQQLFRQITLLTGLTVPGSFAPGELAKVIEAIDPGASPGRDGATTGDPVDGPVTATLGLIAEALRTGHPQLLDDATERLRRAIDGGGTQFPDDRAVWITQLLFPTLLSTLTMTSGNRQDLARARGWLDSLSAAATAVESSPHATGPGSAGLLLSFRILRIQLRLGEIQEQYDADAPEKREPLEALLAELRALDTTADHDGEWYFLIPFLLGTVRLHLALLLRDLAELHRAQAHFATVLEDTHSLPVVRPMLESVRVQTLTLTALLEEDPERVAEAVRQARPHLTGTPAAVDQHVLGRQAIALALRAAYEMTGDTDRLDELVKELEEARRGLTEHSSAATAGSVLWDLARAYQEQGTPALAVPTALESLRLVAEDVLLQFGAEDGLQAARAGARRGLLAAGWAARAGRIEETVECLETGRALVLRAAATARTVPEQLEARGEPELAAKWRQAVRDLAEGGAPAPYDTGTPAGSLVTDPRATLVVPSALRRRALDALRRPDGDRPDPRGLLTVPGLDQLLEGVRTSAVDALVHLVPGEEGGDGAAVLLPRRGAPRVLPLPGLAADGRAPLEAYLDAAATRSAAAPGGGPDPVHERAWRDSLNELVAWAGPAVVEPVLDALRPVDGTVPRLVLVACGNLGAVPWHAAVLTSDAHGRSGRRYACEEAVISYAASGAEFLSAAARTRAVTGERAVLVADPWASLGWAPTEVEALHAAAYPEARLMGHLPGGQDASGTPGDILAVLPGGDAALAATVLHIASHARAGDRPTASALELASPQGDPEGGLLTVTHILDHMGGHRGANGPLVVLSACETDLSHRDHDEALTPTTAFVAGGASDAVGSRWQISDSSSAVMMVVFHHFLTSEGLAPPDALRAAQLWMLDTDREPVPGLRGRLRGQASRSGLARLPAWAAFIHQGNPAPAGRENTV